MTKTLSMAVLSLLMLAGLALPVAAEDKETHTPGHQWIQEWWLHAFCVGGGPSSGDGWTFECDLLGGGTATCDLIGGDRWICNIQPAPNPKDEGPVGPVAKPDPVSGVDDGPSGPIGSAPVQDEPALPTQTASGATVG